MKRRNACWPLSTTGASICDVEGFRSAEDERDFRTVFVSLFHKEDQELAQAGWSGLKPRMRSSAPQIRKGV